MSRMWTGRTWRLRWCIMGWFWHPATLRDHMRTRKTKRVAAISRYGVELKCRNTNGDAAALGGTVGGLAFGSVGGAVGGALVGALAGNLVGRALDDQERRRLAEATQRAYVGETNEPVVYTVEPKAPPPAQTAQAPAPAQPTIVGATPVGPKASRPDGSTCRPIELTATKNGQTTRETTTFCQAAGSSELKPVSV